MPSDSAESQCRQGEGIGLGGFHSESLSLWEMIFRHWTSSIGIASGRWRMDIVLSRNPWIPCPGLTEGQAIC